MELRRVGGVKRKHVHMWACLTGGAGTACTCAPMRMCIDSKTGRQRIWRIDSMRWRQTRRLLRISGGEWVAVFDFFLSFVFVWGWGVEMGGQLRWPLWHHLSEVVLG